MPSDRRMGVEGLEMWSLLLDSEERLMRDKGYGGCHVARGFTFGGGYDIPSHALAKKIVSDFLEKAFRHL